MVLTRSQTSTSNQLETIDLSCLSDNESEATFPECKSRGASINVETANLLDLEIDHDRIRNDQRFIETKNQISELTLTVKALEKPITSTNSNDERNRHTV